MLKSARLKQAKRLLLNLLEPSFLSQYRLLLKTLSISDSYALGLQIQSLKSQAGQFRKIKIALLSNFTCAHIQYYLRTLLLAEGIELFFYETQLSRFSAPILSESSPLYQFDPDLILILVDETCVLENMPVSWQVSAHLEAACEIAGTWMQEVMSTLRKYSRGLVILNTLQVSAGLMNQVIDYQSKNKLLACFHNLNKRWIDGALLNPYLIILDPSLLLQNSAVTAFQDARLCVYAKMSFHDSLLYALSQECVKIVLARLALSKKCLVLDLDNTLWGGLVGEFGPSGITIGGEYEGAAYDRFQKCIKSLKNQGIVLAINSKNEFANVREVLTQHAGMTLVLDDFVSIHSNWLPKSENIKNIAKELNLALESLVFVDDNAAECALVQKYLPEVETLHLSLDPACYVEELTQRGFFNRLETTLEDGQRTESYLAQVKRNQHQQSYENIEAYLHDLAIQMHIFLPRPFDLARIAQLTMRTNQFNLTGLRCTHSEVEALIDRGWIIWAIEAEDRFGRNGLIASVFMERIDQHLWIRNFLMSCRVFSRHIEQAILYELIWFSKRRGLNLIMGEIQPTAKNKIAQDFYLKHGFQVFDQTPLIPIPGLNEAKAHKPQKPELTHESVRIVKCPVQGKDHFKQGVGMTSHSERQYFFYQLQSTERHQRVPWIHINLEGQEGSEHGSH